MLHLDENNFPCTREADGTLNKDDQLQRVAMIYLVGYRYFQRVIQDNFEVSPGVYKRHPKGRASDLSGDALISILAAYVAHGRFNAASEISWQILKRKGFAQNIHDMYGREEKKTPDFILLRALPLMWRSCPAAIIIRHLLFGLNVVAAVSISKWWALAFIFTTDLPLLLAALMANAPVWKDDKGFEGRTPDDVDDNVIIMTFIACGIFRTPLSYLSPRIFAKLRPWNFGCRKDDDGKYFGPVYGALRWYHREPAGNSTIATLYRGVVQGVFGEDNKEA